MRSVSPHFASGLLGPMEYDGSDALWHPSLGQESSSSFNHVHWNPLRGLSYHKKSDWPEATMLVRPHVDVLLNSSNWGTFLIVQWIRIFLPMQRTRVQSLVWEDLTCLRATKHMHHNYWACALEPGIHNYWSPHTLDPMLCNKRSHCNEKLVQWEACAPQGRAASTRHN